MCGNINSPAAERRDFSPPRNKPSVNIRTFPIATNICQKDTYGESPEGDATNSAHAPPPTSTDSRSTKPIIPRIIKKVGHRFDRDFNPKSCVKNELEPKAKAPITPRISISVMGADRISICTIILTLRPG